MFFFQILFHYNKPLLLKGDAVWPLVVIHFVVRSCSACCRMFNIPEPQTLNVRSTPTVLTHISKCPPKSGTSTWLGTTVLSPLKFISVYDG